MPTPFAPLQLLSDTSLQRPPAQLSVLRLDQIPPAYSGNKYFKLKYNLEQAKKQHATSLLSFGGAYSNHIHALARVGKDHGLDTIGVIRGESTYPLNPTLQDAKRAGMTLHFVSRQEYRRRYDSDYLSELAVQFKDSYIIPEGGSNLSAVRGCMEIVDHLHHHVGSAYDLIILPCATAATLAGVIAAVPDDKYVIGVAVLNNADWQRDQVVRYLNSLNIIDNKRWRIDDAYHCGGYAKLNKSLADFMTSFERYNDIAIEPVYSGKMFYALYQLLDKQLLSPDTRVVAVHTGGLQGLRGMKAKLERFKLG